MVNRGSVPVPFQAAGFDFDDVFVCLQLFSLCLLPIRDNRRVSDNAKYYAIDIIKGRYCGIQKQK